jgi:hypothetical protein
MAVARHSIRGFVKGTRRHHQRFQTKTSSNVSQLSLLLFTQNLLPLFTQPMLPY